MTFKPPQWYHDNEELSYENLKELKFDIDFIGSEKYAKENKESPKKDTKSDTKKPESKKEEKKPVSKQQTKKK